MVVVTSDFLIGVRTNFRALYQREFLAATGLRGWQSLALKMDSDSELNTYEWFGTVPRMQDVTHGPVELAGLREDNFSLTNRSYQAAIEVKREAFERDKLGLIAPRIAQLGQEAARHPGELLFGHVRDNDNAFDAASYFGNTRVIGDSANIDNNLSGTGITVAQISTDLGVAKGAMRSFEDYQSMPAEIAKEIGRKFPALASRHGRTLRKIVKRCRPLNQDKRLWLK